MSTESQAAATCWECGYSLRGLDSRRCPECGRPFDPADETTMNMGQAVGPVTRWLISPPGWPVHWLTGVAVLVSLWAAAAPTPRGAFSDELGKMLLLPRGYLWDKWAPIAHLADPYGRFLIGVVLWALVAGAWVGRRVARGATVRRLSRQKAPPSTYWRRWLVTPIVFWLTVLACMTPLPVIAGFWVSKPWLERAAEDARARPPLALVRERWAGIHPGVQAYVEPALDEVEIRFGGVGFFIRSEKPIGTDTAAIRYRQWNSNSVIIRHLYGPWYYAVLER